MALMRTPATYGPSVERVDVIETHIARVFLAGDEAYKVRKRVHLRFVDFSTLFARHSAAVREMELNRPHAPGLYLGLVPIVRTPEGHLRLGGSGEPIEWAVRMRRFPQEALLSHREKQGPLTEELAKSLADMVARYHQDSPIRDACDGARILAPVIQQLSRALSYGHAHVAEGLVSAFERVSQLLTERGMTGCVRRCHGDLHLGNIVLIDDVPVPFDALEFSEALATIDVLYDLAFLLMDLDARNDRQAANAVFNAYVAFEPIGGEIEGLACLPLFLACRAAVRAVVAMARSEQLVGEEQAEMFKEVRRNAALARRLSCARAAARHRRRRALGHRQVDARCPGRAADRPGAGRPARAQRRRAQAPFRRARDAASRAPALPHRYGAARLYHPGGQGASVRWRRGTPSSSMRSSPSPTSGRRSRRSRARRAAISSGCG